MSPCHTGNHFSTNTPSCDQTAGRLFHLARHWFQGAIMGVTNEETCTTSNLLPPPPQTVPVTLVICIVLSNSQLLSAPLALLAPVSLAQSSVHHEEWHDGRLKEGNATSKASDPVGAKIVSQYCLFTSGSKRCSGRSSRSTSRWFVLYEICVRAVGSSES